MKISSKRAEYTSLVGVVLSILFFVFTWILGGYSGSFAVSALKWQFLAGAVISAVLWFQFHLRSLAEQEKLDIAQLAKGRQEQTIFQAKGERMDMFAVSQKRLELFEKWFLPILAVFLVCYQIGIGTWLVAQIPVLAAEPARQAQVVAIFMFVIAFITFLISRYTTGMSAHPEWKPLRAGGSWLLGCAVIAFLSAISLGLAQLKYYLPHIILGWVVPIAFIVLGTETVLSVIFGIYRPRITGQYHRSSFDSRILGLFSEPGGVFHNIAHTMDYQFGFKVSQTWFYKLVEKAVLPLVLLSIAVLWGMSCFLVVGPGQQAIVERFGEPLNQGQSLNPGIHCKLPWPIDIAYKEDVKQIEVAYIGFVPKENAGREPLLWGRPHYKQEDNLLVGSSSRSSISEEGAGSFSIVVTAVPVHYRIKNLHDFIYENGNPREMLAALAYRELTGFAVSAKIETNRGDDDSILGAGRGRAAGILQQRIQNAADENMLGVEIVFVGLEGVHPPKEVAEDYQAVIGAVQTKQAAILGSMAERNKILASLGGSVEQVRQLHKLAKTYQQAKFDNGADVKELELKFDKAMTQAQGDIYKKLRSAQSAAFEKATRAKADGQRFDSQLKAFRAAPDIYTKELRLSMFEQALNNVRKYILIADVNDYQVLIFDLKDKIVQSLYDIEVSEEGK